MPNLIELNAEENEIVAFNKLENLPKLKRLLLAKNKMKKIRTPLPILPSLYHLNIADNLIDKFSEILKCCKMKSILSFTVLGNPFDEVADSKKQILMIFNYFEKINEENITPEDLIEAENALREKREEEERKRLEELEIRMREDEEKKK